MWVYIYIYINIYIYTVYKSTCTAPNKIPRCNRMQAVCSRNVNPWTWIIISGRLCLQRRSEPGETSVISPYPERWFWIQQKYCSFFSAVFIILQDVVSICAKIKALYSKRFLLPEHSLDSSRHGSKTARNRFPKADYNFSIVFPGSRPPKTWKHQQNEGFWGGSAAGARPR